MRIEFDRTTTQGVNTLMYMGNTTLDGVLSDSEEKLKGAAIAGVVGYLASRFLGFGPPKLVGLGLFGYFFLSK